MNTSESINKIAVALLQAQRAITFAVKDSSNPHFKSKYADLSSVIEACKPALNNAGICFIQMMAPSDHGSIALTTRLLHESGEWIESTATCPLPKNDPQGYGSANTYLRRYGLAAAVGLYQDDDDGNAASKKGPAKAFAQPHSPTRIAFESMSAEWKDYLTGEAEIIERMEAPAALKYISGMFIGPDERAALESLLPSKLRTAISAITKGKA